MDEPRKTYIFVGVFGFSSIIMMTVRLIMRKVRRQKFILSDYLTMIAIFCVFGRTSFTTVALLYQNNNIAESFRETHTFTAKEVYERETGSKLTLVDRAVYNTYLWIQKSVVLLLYQRMLGLLEWPARIIKAYWVILFLTFVAVQISAFVECRPFYLYWQVVPDPGTCTKADVQIYVLVSMNVFTDILLIFLPMPWLLRMRRSLTQRLQLVGLFSIGFALIVVAICRLPVYGDGATQVNRTTLGSIEEFFAAFVANVPTLFTLRKPTTSARSSEGSHEVGRGGASGQLSPGNRGSHREETRQISSFKREGSLSAREMGTASQSRSGIGNEYLQHSRSREESCEELV